MSHSEHTGIWARQRDELFIALQRLVPQHTASRMLGKIADCEQPWLKNRLISLALDHYGIDLSEAQISDPYAYPSFNTFFTRQLRSGIRPVCAEQNALVCPADGTISQIGAIEQGTLVQAKGFDFSVQQLLACDAPAAAHFKAGSFTTIYLSPKDYHRVHFPFHGRLLEATYIPGKLYSVNDTTARHIDGLFTRNERLSALFDTEHGKMAVVLVGALFVAGIETVWQQRFHAGRLEHRTFADTPAFSKGDELGKFKFGSTVIVLTEKKLIWDERFKPQGTCSVGEKLGTF